MFDLSGFTKVTADKGAELADATLKRIYDERASRKQGEIARIHKDREWWMKYLPWLKPLTDDQAENLRDTRWIEYAWGDEYACRQVLLLCKHSEDGYVYLMPELLRAITYR